MSNRTLQDWASISDILGGIAVVVALIFVGYELRENTIALESGTRQEFAAQDLAFLSTGLDPSVIAVANSKLLAGEELSLLEFDQLVARQHMNFRVFENAFYQYEIGALEESEWGRYSAIVERLMCGYRPASVMWKNDRESFVPSFISAVDAIEEACVEETVLSGQ